MGAIGSGALVLTASEPETESVLANLEEQGIDAFVIGRVVERDQGVKLLRGQERLELPRFVTDEISRVLGMDTKNPESENP